MKTLTHGLAAGFVGTQVLDVLSSFFYQNLSAEDRMAEDRARSGHQAYEVMVMNAAKAAGLELTEEQIKYWGWRFHRGFGLSGGVQYIALREKFPAVGAGCGLLFGIGFWLVADELMIYLTKSTPGPQNFSWKAHARGFAAHVAYGVAMELTARTFDYISDYEDGIGWAKEEDKARLTQNQRVTKGKRVQPKRTNLEPSLYSPS